jgi:hypothetical protein
MSRVTTWVCGVHHLLLICSVHNEVRAKLQFVPLLFKLPHMLSVP